MNQAPSTVQSDASPLRVEENMMKRIGAALMNLPIIHKVFGVALLMLYVPVFVEAGRVWMSNDLYAHQPLILPLSIGLLWLLRNEIAAVHGRPDRGGLYWLAFGLIIQTLGYILQISFVAAVSIIPVLAGIVLLLYGKAMWRTVWFPISYLFFAAPIPGFVLTPLIVWVQHVSSNGAAFVMQTLGYAIIQRGNILEIPGMSLEVAEACSGFKKMMAFFAFAILYGYMYKISMAKRIALIVIAVPVAVLANIIRVSGLVAVSAAGGEAALHKAHDWAEVSVIVVAFLLFVMIGKLFGCKTLRFSL